MFFRRGNTIRVDFVEAGKEDMVTFKYAECMKTFRLCIIVFDKTKSLCYNLRVPKIKYESIQGFTNGEARRRGTYL